MSLQNACWTFSQTFIIHHIEKVFVFTEFAFLENFYSCLSPLKTCRQVFIHHALGKRKLLIPPGSILSKISFPQQQKGMDKTMICFIKI